MKRNIAFITAALLLVAAAAFADDSAEKRFTATVDKDGVQRIELLAGSYYFDPNVVVVKKDIPVELTIKTAGGFISHDIAAKSPEAGIVFHLNLTSKPQTIKFTPTKTGTYPFECTERFLFFKSHTDRGMHGRFEVVD